MAATSASSRSIPTPASSPSIATWSSTTSARVINPVTLKGQIHGGVAQGVGQALLEQIVYEPGSGQLLTASFMEYAMPRADTFCDMHIESNPVPTKLNPMGAKGAGEAGTVGALPVVINAVMSALGPARRARLRHARLERARVAGHPGREGAMTPRRTLSNRAQCAMATGPVKSHRSPLRNSAGPTGGHP